MIISVNFDWQESSNTAWVLPIPSSPESIDADVADGAPVFEGIDVLREAGDDLSQTLSIFLFSYLTSIIVPVPITLVLYPSGLISGAGGGGVTVYKHFEKYGFTVEVVSATEGMGIYDYLADNGLEISPGAVPQLDEYVEEEFSFVLMWMSSSESSTREPGLIVEFPTKRIFYPLVLTSIYGDDTIPVEIMIAGHVSPNVYDEIERSTEVTYWRGSLSEGYLSVSPEVRNFVDEIKNRWDGSFTRIEISTPSSAFKKDLWIEDRVPEKVKNAETIHRMFNSSTRFPSLLLLFLAISLPLGFGLGVGFFGRKKEKFPFYILMGLGNMLGIIGLVAVTLAVAIDLDLSLEKASQFVCTFVIAFFMAFIALFIAFNAAIM